MKALGKFKKAGNEEKYYINLPVFEGPFDLLFHLITKEEIDIWEIPLGRITEQYLLYLKSMRELDIDIAGDFLVMAASLLHLKSKMLIPQSPSFNRQVEEEALFFGSKEELVRSLLEYRRIKLIAENLKRREEQQQRIFLRSPGARKVVIINKQITLYPNNFETLADAYKKLVEKKSNLKKERKLIKIPEEFSFADKVRQILYRLKKMASINLLLDDFLVKKERGEIVVTFFAFLELAKQGKLTLLQEKLYGKIRILKKS